VVTSIAVKNLMLANVGDWVYHYVMDGARYRCSGGWAEESHDITTEYIGMGIHVILVNGDTGNVDGGMLDHLIRVKEVAAFRRAEGWVQIGCDPIRNTQQPLTRSGNRRDDLPS
jgi:hypothetical protein